MTLTNFRASDFNKDGSEVKSLGSKRDRRVAAPVPTPTPTTTPIDKNADPNDVPSGTVPEVLTWVGEDPERAQKALYVEVENAKPRKGLVEQLNEIISKESDEEDVENSVVIEEESDDSSDESDEN